MSFVFTPCTSGFQYFTVPSEIQNFANAEAQCATQGGQLAIPRSLSQYNTILEHGSLTNEDRIWIGLTERQDVVLDDNDTERFLRVDGERNSFTAEAGFGNFPWNLIEPNDNFGAGNEECIELSIPDILLNDINCVNTFGYLCERSCSGECLAGLQLSIAPEESVNFDEAEALCELQGGQMVVPATSARLTNLKDFALPFSNVLPLLGLIDRTDTPVSGDTERFLDVNGEPNGFTSREPFEFPWNSLDPNGLSGENCVEFDVNANVIRDNNCQQQIYTAVCEKNCGEPPQFVFDQCLDGIQVYYNSKQQAFDEALVDCKSVDASGKLLVPSNQAKLDRATALMTPAGSFLAYVGLINYAEVIVDPAFFLTADTGEALDFITLGDRPPWGIDQPDNSGGNGQFCVMVQTDGTLIDIECESFSFESVCERPCDDGVASPVVFDQCVDGTQFFFNPDLKTFDDAQASCKSIDSSANLAIPTTSTKFAQLQSFLQLNTNTDNHFIGLRNFAQSNIITEDFLTVNNNPNPFTSGLAGVNPWLPSEPNNFGGSQFCGTMFGSNALVDDLQCEAQISSLCERYCGVQPVFEFGECEDNIQFFFNPELRTWDAAQADCKSIDAQGKLAIPTDQVTMDRINALFEEHRTGSSNAHIGLRDFIQTGGFSLDRFVPVEGIDNPFTGSTGSALYLRGEPNDAGSSEDCLATAFSQGLLFDGNCSNLEFSVCQRPCVVLTESPTDLPTISPTANPTPNPSINPTNKPTTSPTPKPTNTLTNQPTTSPTANPTNNPTENPTTNPTEVDFVFSGCVDGFQYFTKPGDNQIFSEALSQCASQGGQLAIPRSLNQYNTIIEQAALANDDQIWLGLEQREDVVLASGNTERFIRLDGERNSFTAEPGFGNFPWIAGEPNNFQGTSEECVDLVLSSGLINDIFCTSSFAYLCERSCSGECIDGLELSIAAGELVNLDQAEDFCDAQGAQLAVPTSIARLNDLTAFATSYDVDSLILGLVDTTESAASGVTDRFLDVNGLQNGFTNRDPFLSPWGALEPTGDFDKNCVELDLASGLLRETVCEEESYTVVCEKSCGTKPEFVFDTCINGTQLYFNPERRGFDEALVDCKNVDIQGTLAVPRDQESIDRIGAFRAQVVEVDFLFLGLRNFEQKGLDASLFLSLTGEFNNFTAIGNQDPWVPNEPNNEGSEFCLSMRATALLNDLNCDRTRPSICERPCDAAIDSPVVFDECVDGTQFFFNPDLKTFDQAEASCESIDSGGNLAIPTTDTKFAQMQSFFPESIDAFIGLRNVAQTPAITGDFLTVNGQPNPFTSGLIGETPWRTDEPNNAGNEFCGAFSGFDFLLNDLSCEATAPSICERYCGVQPAFEFDECVNDVQFYFNPELRTWDGAQADCRSVDALGKLAIPSDAEEFLRITDLFQTHRTESQNAYLGLRDFLVASDTDTSRFIPFEGLINSFTSGPAGIVPWQTDQPDNSTGDENCVAVSFNDNLLQDESCTSFEFSVCQRPCNNGLTESPTRTLTSSPSKAPTGQPTISPTQRQSRCTRRTFGITNPTKFF